MGTKHEFVENSKKLGLCGRRVVLIQSNIKNFKVDERERLNFPDSCVNFPGGTLGCTRKLRTMSK